MKLLLLSDSYPPDIKSGAFLIQTLAEYLSAKGYQVSVITFSKNLIKNYTEETIKNVKVIRIRIPSFKYNLKKRAFVEISYSFKIISYLKRNYRDDIDGIIFYSPTIFFGHAVQYIKKNFSVKSYLIVRDLFPDWAVSIGILKKGLIYNFFKFFEKKMMISADFIGVEAKADIEHCKNIIGDERVIIEHLLNWGPPIDSKQAVTSEYVDREKFNLIYGGNLGIAQNFISFLEYLKLVEDENFRLIIVGDGNEKEKIKNFIADNNMDILILPSMPRDDYLSIIKFCDAGLVVIDKKIKANNYPAKSFDYMSYEKPIFAYLNKENEFGNMISEFNFGYYVCSGGMSFEESFKKMIHNKQDRILKGKNAKLVLESHFSVKNAGERILKKFNINNIL